MLKRLKDILNIYSDVELENTKLWIDSDVEIESIYIDKENIVLITEAAEVKINDVIEKESSIK